MYLHNNNNNNNACSTKGNYLWFSTVIIHWSLLKGLINLTNLNNFKLGKLNIFTGLCPGVSITHNEHIPAELDKQ